MMEHFSTPASSPTEAKLLPGEALSFSLNARHELLHPIKNRPDILEVEARFAKSLLLAGNAIADKR